MQIVTDAMPCAAVALLVDVWREVAIINGLLFHVVLFRFNNGPNHMLVRELRKLPPAVSDEDPHGSLSLYDYLVQSDEASSRAESIFARVDRSALSQMVQFGYVPRGESCDSVLVSEVSTAARSMGYPEAYARELESLVAVHPPQRALSLPNRLPLHHEDPLPSELPKCNLQDHILLQGYGVARADLGDRLALELQRYIEYSTADVNLERVQPAYRQSVQTATIIGETDRMRGFLGFLTNRLDVDICSIGLPAYWNATFVARFISFLIARGTAKGTVLKHLAQAKKVSFFLASARTTSKKEKEYSERYADWLDVLSGQLARSLPDSVGWGELPPYTSVRQWVDSLRRMALERVDEAMELNQNMRRDLAILVQRAIIASLVTGRDFPPLRLHLIKVLFRPVLDPRGKKERRRCRDPDCQRGASCLGNRLEFKDYDEDGVPQGLRLHVVHHKTDRRGPVSREPFQFDIKESDLLSLLLVHFLHTRDLLFNAVSCRSKSLQTASARVS